MKFPLYEVGAGAADRRAPQGARGLKFVGVDQAAVADLRRAPQGARGLKCRYTESELTAAIVAPRKGRVG